jgi:hypothetical protein
LRSFADMLPQASVCASGGYRVTGSAHAWGHSPRHERNTAPRRTALAQIEH